MIDEQYADIAKAVEFIDECFKPILDLEADKGDEVANDVSKTEAKGDSSDHKQNNKE